MNKFAPFFVIGALAWSLYRVLKVEKLRHSIYILTNNGRTLIFEQGCTLPLKEIKTFSVVDKKQSCAEFRIYTNEKVIGRVVLQDLLKKPITLEMNVDINHNVTVFAKQENCVTLYTRVGSN